jgi:hypothetical protein
MKLCVLPTEAFVCLVRIFTKVIIYLYSIIWLVIYDLDDFFFLPRFRK